MFVLLEILQRRPHARDSVAKGADPHVTASAQHSAERAGRVIVVPVPAAPPGHVGLANPATAALRLQAPAYLDARQTVVRTRLRVLALLVSAFSALTEQLRVVDSALPLPGEDRLPSLQVVAPLELFYVLGVCRAPTPRALPGSRPLFVCSH